MRSNWRTVAEIVAAASVVVSLIFVGYELRMSRSIAFNESFGQSTEIAVELSDYLSSNSEIWLKGCAGDDLSIDEEFQYLQLMGAWDAWNFARWQRARAGISPSGTDRWVRTTALNLYRYDGFRKYWRMHQDLQATESNILGEQPDSGYEYEVELLYNEYVGNNLPAMYPVSSCGK